jgi:hypothetical protein
VAPGGRGQAARRLPSAQSQAQQPWWLSLSPSSRGTS